MNTSRAVAFLVDALHFKPEEANLRFNDKLAFLALFVQRFYQNEPFTNYPTLLYLLNSQEKLDITSIPLEWVLQELEQRKGGACFVQAIGAQMFLDQLGFDCYYSITYVENRAGSRILHFVTIVQNVSQEGDRYLLDFGTRLSPLMQPIPLHIFLRDEQESECYDSCYMFNKFMRQGDEILRYTGKIEDKPDAFYFYRIKQIPEIVDVLSDDGLNIEIQKFPSATQEIRRPGLEKGANFWMQLFFIVGFPEGKPCVYRNLEKRYPNSEGGTVRKMLESREQLIQELVENYPQYGASTIQESIDNLWNIIFAAKE